MNFGSILDWDWCQLLSRKDWYAMAHPKECSWYYGYDGVCFLRFKRVHER